MFQGKSFAQPRGILAIAVVTLCLAAGTSRALTLELSGQVRTRPQNVDVPTKATGTTVLLDDETITLTAVARGARDSFPTLVIERRNLGSNAWAVLRTLYDTSRSPALALPVGGIATSSRDLMASRIAGTTPKPVIPTESFTSAAVDMPKGMCFIRATARRRDGTTVSSPALSVDCREAPQVLTLLAMGGTCTDPDANTTFTSLADAGITRDATICANKGVQATYLADLTPMEAVNCNNPCAACTNFFEHLALRIMNSRDLANEFESINNPGDAKCDRRTNAEGIRNHLIFGKWRNTEEEPVCGTTIDFDKIIDDYRAAGGKALILIGQSQGGAKLAGMVRDHWRWGTQISLELLVLWDATSFDVLNGFDTGHFGITSMGVRKVGDKPKRILNFCQYSNPVPFQNGAPLDPSEAHANLEEHDLDGCQSHNGIARSQFVHHRTTDVVKEVLQSIRDKARS